MPDFFRTDTHLDHQNHDMIGEVGNLVNGFRTVAALAGDDDLGALFAHLFQDLVGPLLEQIAGVGALGEFFFPIQQRS